MNSLKAADVYRVAAVSVGRWGVFKAPTSAPVASFNNKAAALNYAMCLARGRIAWHLLLRSGNGTIADVLVDGRDARH